MAETVSSLIPRLVATMVLLIWAVAAPAVLAQGPAIVVPDRPPATPPGAGQTAEPPGTYHLVPQSPAPSLPPAPVCVDEFWIASSWRCRQHRPHCCAGGDLEFYRLAGCGSAQPLNREAFHASLQPGAPVCVVAHGSFTNWQGLCDECAPVFRWLRSPAPHRPLHVIFYTWPSNGPITFEPHVDVAILGSRASFNSVYLGDLIARIPPGHPICVVGHSHGARMAAAGLHLLGGGQIDGVRLTYLPPPDQRIRGVLIAAAMDHHWLDPGERFELALCRTECLLNFRNDHDIALQFYPWRRVFSRRALGERGLSRRDRYKLGPLGGKVAEIDVTDLVQHGHMWNNYYTRPELAAAMAPYVFNDSATAAMAAPAPSAVFPTPALPAPPPQKSAAAPSATDASWATVRIVSPR
jgi:hypothetical protein